MLWGAPTPPAPLPPPNLPPQTGGGDFSREWRKGGVLDFRVRGNDGLGKRVTGVVVGDRFSSPALRCACASPPVCGRGFLDSRVRGNDGLGKRVTGVVVGDRFSSPALRCACASPPADGRGFLDFRVRGNDGLGKRVTGVIVGDRFSSPALRCVPSRRREGVPGFPRSRNDEGGGDDGLGGGVAVQSWRVGCPAEQGGTT